MNGNQARAMRATWNEARLWWINYHGFVPFSISPDEWYLLLQLWDEFYPDEGNLYRIPLIIREED